MSRLFPREATARLRVFASVAILLALTLLAPLAVVSAPLTSVFVNGVRVDAYPVIHDGVAYLPIQVMAQAMEAEIIWDAKLGTVKVNGTTSPASIYNQNGKILLPIESFITGLGGDVVYDGRNNMIRVETPEYMATGPSRAKGTASAISSKGNSASTATGSNSGKTTVAPVVATTAAVGTTAALANRNSSSTASTPAYGTAPAATTTPAYGTYNHANTTPAYGTAGQTAYGNTGYGNNTMMRGTETVMAPQSASTVKPSFRPPYANNAMQAGATSTTPGFFPSSGATINGTAPNVGINAIPSLSQAGNSPYIPRTAQNSVFKVTVSNLEVVPVIKDFYKPRTGSKFVVASLSQQNISNQVQIYTGKFSLVDQNQNSYDHLEGLSNFWLVILRPYGVNFGYLVFEIPQNSKPISLVLHALNQAPLTINL